MGIEQSMIQKRVGHDRITSFHTVFQNLRTVGCLNFYDIFDVCLSVCHPQMTRNSVHLFLPPKRKDRAILENSNISFSVYPELINFQKWFCSVRQLFSGAFIVCVLEGNYNNELRDINFLSCSLDRDRIDNYSITQTDVTKNSFFFKNSKIPRTQVPPFFLHYCTLRENAPKLVYLRKILSCSYIRLKEA